jgi:hypothetical protein
MVFALWASQAISSQLYEARPTDPATYLALAVVLAGVALSAILIPAYRPATVDLMIVLRDE